jgi:hypothetical protein
LKLLRLGLAGRFEIDGAELFVAGMGWLRQRNAGRKRHRNCKGCSHRASPVGPPQIKQRISNCPIEIEQNPGFNRRI